jgi:hypothetical protein
MVGEQAFEGSVLATNVAVSADALSGVDELLQHVETELARAVPVASKLPNYAGKPGAEVGLAPVIDRSAGCSQARVPQSAHHVLNHSALLAVWRSEQKQDRPEL